MPDLPNLDTFRLPPNSYYIAQRLAARIPPRFGVRLVPKHRFSGNLASPKRLYTCIADLEEMKGLPVAEVARRVYGLIPPAIGPESSGLGWFNYSLGTYHVPYTDQELLNSEEFYAITLDVERYPSECDMFPGTWKSLAFILCDRDRMQSRMEIFERFYEIRHGSDPFQSAPKDLIDFWELPTTPHELLGCNTAPRNGPVCYYDFLSTNSLFMDEIVDLFGTHNRCWHGGGYIGVEDTLLSRVFLVRNLSLRSAPILDVRLLRRDDRLPV